jgi:SAM-dependent methyltransferase
MTTLEYDPCICGHRMLLHPFSEHFDVLMCTACATQHFISKPGLSVLEFSYNDHNDKYSEQGYLYGRELRWSHRILLKFDWRERRTLEIGCFNGFFVSELSYLGADAHGVDVNEQALLVGRDSFDLAGRLHSTLEMAAGEGPFDDVLCIDVIEHLEDPGSFIAMVSKLLRPKGRIFIAGPTVERRFFDKSDFPPHHKWRFSRPGLSNFLRRNGFSLESEFVQHDGMLLLRNTIGKYLSGPRTKEFYGEITVKPPSTEKGFAGALYNVFSRVGTLVFTILRIPYCSAVLVATKNE